jgi:hypothetical protein
MTEIPYEFVDGDGNPLKGSITLTDEAGAVYTFPIVGGYAQGWIPPYERIEAKKCAWCGL